MQKLVQHFVLLIAIFVMFGCNTDSAHAAKAKEESVTPKNEKASSQANTLYFTIVATKTLSLDILSDFKQLKKQFPKLTTINTNDCKNLKPNLVLFVSHVNNNEGAAKVALEKVKTKISDAYIRHCNVQTPSLVSYHLPYLHDSLIQLGETINWSIEDIPSRIIALPEGVLVLENRFNSDFSEIEGRQNALYFIDNSVSKNTKTLLVEHCWEFQHFTTTNDKILFQCATAMAGMEWIHTVYVFDKSGQQLFAQEYCQTPTMKDKKLTCQEESVNEFGELSTQAATFTIK